MKSITITLVLALNSAIIMAGSSPNPFTNLKHLQVNTVTGDASFVEKFGIVPNHNTDEKLRLSTHLEYVENLLRSKDVSHLPKSLQQERKKMLGILHAYWNAGRFPVNYDFPGQRRPCFIDKNNNICAVGYLIAQTAGWKVAEEINARYKYEYLLNMEMPEIDAWIAASGLTKTECAMIQPCYGGACPPASCPSSLIIFQSGNMISVNSSFGCCPELSFGDLLWSTGETTPYITITAIDSVANYSLTATCGSNTYTASISFDPCKNFSTFIMVTGSNHDSLTAKISWTNGLIDNSLCTYQWNTGETTASIQNDMWENWHSVTVTASNGCVATANLNTTNLKETLAEENEVLISPNPFGDNISINTLSKGGEELAISITDIAGKIIIGKTLPKDQVNGNAVINTAGILPGIYFVKIESEYRNEVKKIIKY